MSDVLARGEHPGMWNLAVGEPWFIQDALTLGNVEPQIEEYPYPRLGGEKTLIEELGWLYPGQYIVVANGAKQALLAAFHAYGLRDKDIVAHEPPYWPSYKELARFSGMAFSPHTHMADAIHCITSPNNPDGRQMQGLPSKRWRCDVWDAAYAHPVYGWNGLEPQYTVMVGSASKRLGLSGQRVGWLVTSVKEIADDAAKYVEATTSGVAVMSQLQVAMVLKLHREHPSYAMTEFAAARKVLQENCEAFRYFLYDHCGVVSGAPSDNPGMFAWFLPVDFQKMTDAFQRANVLFLDGKHCGMEGWIRLSMGHRQSYTAEALERVAKELHVG